MIDRSASPREPGFKPNPGRLPDDAKGKRVLVELRNGKVCGKVPVTSTSAPGWAADGRAPTMRWSLTGDPFDVVGYKVL